MLLLFGVYDGRCVITEMISVQGPDSQKNTINFILKLL